MPRIRLECTYVENQRCVFPDCGNPCIGQPEITCFFKSTKAQKCGYVFTQSDDYKRFATATVSVYGQRMKTYNSADPHPCQDEQDRVGIESGDPLTMVATSTPHIAVAGEAGCSSGRSCSVTSGNEGYADPKDYILDTDPPPDPLPTAFDGILPDCMFGLNLPLGPAVDPPGGVGVNATPRWPTNGFFYDESKDPPDQYFEVTTYDQDLDLEDQPGWTLTANTSTHRQVTWDGNEDHDSEGNGCSGYNTSVTNTYDVLMSDEIPDSDLQTAVHILPDVEVDEPVDGLCDACYAVNAVEARAQYTAAVVRFTNTSGFALNITWKLNVSGASLGSSGSETEDCRRVLDPTVTTDHSVCLEPGWTHDIELFPDIYSGGQAMWITDIETVCSEEPCP